MFFDRSEPFQIIEDTLARADFYSAIEFPRDRAQFSANNYLNLFIKLQARASSYKKKFPHLVLTDAGPSSALPALIDHLKKQGDIFFSKLTLTLPMIQSSDLPLFLVNIETLLINLSDCGLSEIILEDPNNKITKEDWEKIAGYIKDDQITTTVTLPKQWQKTKIQHEIDDHVSINHRKKILEAAAWEEKKPLLPSPETKTTKRTRPRTKIYMNLEMEREQAQEQQQQREIAGLIRSMDQTYSLQEDKTELPSDLGPKDILTFDVFYKEFKELKFTGLSPAHYFFSRYSIWRQWNIWAGNIALQLVSHKKKETLETIDTNQVEDISPYHLISGTETPIEPEKPKLRITRSAGEQLIRYWRQFQFGIDLHQKGPGTGFKVFRQYDRVVLDYQPTQHQFVKKDPLSIQCYYPDQPQPISQELFNRWQAHFSEDKKSTTMATNVDPLLLEFWKVINKKKYNRHAFQLFKKYLPFMRTLTKPELKKVMDLVFFKHKLDDEKFIFIMTLMQEKQCFNDTIDEKDDSPASAICEKLFTETEALQKCSQLISGYRDRLAKPKKASAKHLIFILIEEEVLRKELATWVKTLSLSDADLNAVLQVYDARGEAGLKALFSFWQTLAGPSCPLLLKDLHSALFSKMKTYLPLLQKPYQDAINIIKGFDSLKYAWWNTLFSQHCAAVGADHLPNLVNAFVQFSVKLGEIQGLGLSFMGPCHFTGTKSLPMTLATILNILKNSTRADLPAQWEEISKLKLQSDSAPRALAEEPIPGDGPKFIVEEMHAHPKHYYTRKPYGYRMEDLASHYSDIGKYYLSNNPLDLEKNFYRFLAVQKHRLPLGFYKKAITAIKSIDLDYPRAKQMYICLLGATTGFSNVLFFNGDLQEAIEQWQSICKLLEKPPGRFGTIVRNSVLSSFLELKELPSLSVFYKLVRFLWNSAEAMDFSNGRKIEAALANAFTNLQSIVRSHDSAIYQGMLYYTDELKSTYTDNSLFYTHLKAAKHITELDPDSYFRSDKKRTLEIQQYLLQLISTFQLANNITDIQRLKKYLNRRNIEIALKFLTKMSTNYRKKPDAKDDKSVVKLTSDDLFHFLDQLETVKDEEGLLKLINKEFGTCYPSHFFLGESIALSSATQSLIESYFSPEIHELIRSLLRNFTSTLDCLYSKDTLCLLRLICSRMRTLEENKSFLSRLNTQSLYQSKPSLEQFNQLLRLIADAGNLHDLSYLLTLNGDKPCDELIVKSMFYQSNVIKFVSEREEKHLTEIETLPLMAKILLLEPSHTLPQGKKQKTLEGLIKDCKEALSQDTLSDWGFSYKISMLSKNLKQFLEENNNLPKLNELSQKISEIKWDDKATASELKELHTYLTEENQKLTGYLLTFENTFRKIYRFIEKYPALKKPLLILFNAYIDQYTRTHDSALNDFQEFVDTILTTFNDLTDLKMFQSLCYQFSASKGPHGAQTSPAHFIQILKLLKKFNKDKAFHLLAIISALVNNAKPIKIAEIKSICELCDEPERGAQFYENLITFYQNVPYPTLQQVLSWHTEAADAKEYALAISTSYLSFDKKPVARDPENGFDAAFAEIQQSRFQGAIFSKENLTRLNAEANKAKDLKTGDLIERLAQFKRDGLPEQKDGATINHPEILALLAELLYRSNGKEGDSSEINTTQYLSLLAMMQSNGRLAAQIGTGEGKSRIIMLLMAYNHLLGKTCDFITHNMQLARRDYFQYEAFFKALNIKTALISEDSLPSDYCTKGINFSDVANISLFRNLSRSHSLEDAKAVIDEDENARALFLDEGDSAEFDDYETRFNSAKPVDDHIKGMEWIYPLLVQFFEQDDHHNKIIDDLFHNDIEACNKAFFNFLEAQGTDAEKMDRVRELDTTQIEDWCAAAYYAKDLILDKHFVIKPDRLIPTPEGYQLSSIIRLLHTCRETRSKYSFGIDQCLLSRMNLTRQKAILKRLQGTALTKLDETLVQCNERFYIEPEKRIYYSSNSKNLIDDYPGQLYFLSGSIGSKIERRETKLLYSKPNREVQFIDAPRHKGLHRDDLPIKLVMNDEEQIKFLFKSIQEGHRKKKPVLIDCRNDAESKTILKELLKLNARLPIYDRIPIDKFQCIHSQLSPEEEDDHVNLIGGPYMTTVSTNMIGRGTHIGIAKQLLEKNVGLTVFTTYMPEEREGIQIFGRSGRYGEPGEARMVLTKPRLEEQLGTPLPNDFYFSTETYINQQQTMVARKNQVERLLRFALCDFRKKTTDIFFGMYNECQSRNKEESLLVPWIQFTRYFDQCWNRTWPNIIGKINKINPDVAIIHHEFNQFSDDINKEWQTLQSKIQKNDPDVKLAPNTHRLELTQATEELMRNFDLQSIAPNSKTAVYHRYDNALDGRAAIYDELFVEWSAIFSGKRKIFANTRAAIDGHGLFFADTRAMFAGQRPPFATLRAWLKRRSQPEPVPSRCHVMPARS